jgi:hypothetical protein
MYPFVEEYIGSKLPEGEGSHNIVLTAAVIGLRSEAWALRPATSLRHLTSPKACRQGIRSVGDGYEVYIHTFYHRFAIIQARPSATNPLFQYIGINASPYGAPCRCVSINPKNSVI